jgi:Gly-Xaa carboxypeptidase
MMNGNTDTKSYWDLSRNIFRFSPGTILPNPAAPGSGIHTVNENVQIQGLVEGHDFYRNLIVAVQGE